MHSRELSYKVYLRKGSLAAILFLFLYIDTSVAQNISGSTTVSVGSVTTYEFFNGTTNSSFVWRVDGGNIQSSSSSGPYYNASILWTSSGAYTIAVLNGMTPVGQLSVTVNSTPVAPATTFSMIYNCGATTITRNTNPPNNVFWYWQTSATGTSTANNSNSYTVNAAGSIFLRPRYSTTWGTAQNVGNITIKNILDSPTASVDGDAISNYSTAVPISVSAVALATSYKWYLASTGESPVGESVGNVYSPIVPSNANVVYYAEGIYGACTSATRKSVVARVHPEPVIGATNQGDIINDSPVTLSVNNYSYDSYQWLDKNGSPIAGYTTASYTTNKPGQYRVRVTKGNSLAFTSSPVTIYSYNYIISTNILEEGVTSETVADEFSVDSRSQVVQFFDDLGRPLQSVSKHESPARQDMVHATKFDSYGRETKQYLPYVDGQTGWFKHDALGDPSQSNGYENGKQYGFYQTGSIVPPDGSPYSETVFEESPLNRVIKQGAVGDVWQPKEESHTDKSIKTSYEFNQANEVLSFDYDMNTNNAVLNTLTYYDANQLYANRTTDEQHHEVVVYVDKEGNTILKKVEYGIDANSNKLYTETYYIYDDFGSLVVVLPPEAIVAIKSSLPN